MKDRGARGVHDPEELDEVVLRYASEHERLVIARAVHGSPVWHGQRIHVAEHLGVVLKIMPVHAKQGVLHLCPRPLSVSAQTDPH